MKKKTSIISNWVGIERYEQKYCTLVNKYYKYIRDTLDLISSDFQIGIILHMCLCNSENILCRMKLFLG